MQLLRNPDRFRVLEMGHSMAELKQIQAEIEAQGHVVEVGIGWQVVDVQLRPGEEERANSYFKRRDNAVVISMGNQTFVPPGCP